MRHRLAEAYLLVFPSLHGWRLSFICRCLTISMQSGYFIQLLTTLAAIVSRITFLLPHFLEVFQLASTTCEGILKLLDVSYPLCEDRNVK
jgi:hypothetical protein